MNEQDFIDVDSKEKETPAVLKIEIVFNNEENTMHYNSDLNDANTVFWLEAVKDLIIGKIFKQYGIQPIE